MFRPPDLPAAEDNNLDESSSCTTIPLRLCLFLIRLVRQYVALDAVTYFFPQMSCCSPNGYLLLVSFDPQRLRCSRHSAPYAVPPT